MNSQYEHLGIHQNHFHKQRPDRCCFKEEWITYLNSNLPLYSRLPDDLRLREKIGEFISTTYFEGCGELELTDEMILTVAGQACMLIINHQGAPDPVILRPFVLDSFDQLKCLEDNPILTERCRLSHPSYENPTFYYSDRTTWWVTT